MTLDFIIAIVGGFIIGLILIIIGLRREKENEDE